MAPADLVIRFAGTAGEGALTAGVLLGSVLARGGYHVHQSVRYEPEMRGERLSMSEVRVSTAPVRGPGDAPDILVGFGKEAVQAHVGDLAPGGLLVYDDKTIDEFGDVTAYRAALPPGTEALARPFLEIAWKKVGRTEAKNIVVLGAVLRVLGVAIEAAEPVLRDRFAGRERVLTANLAALSLGSAEAADAGPDRRLPPGDGRRRVFISGNQAVALGAVAAGCRFFAGYPITPASEIMDELAKLLPRCGGTCLQLEDEMAALGAVLGASFGGSKAMTATSGPGLSLMTELVGLASIAEIPAVLVDVQRGGPSTGLPTRAEQSDLQLGVFGSHGDAPRVVLVPASVADCFARTVEAFNLAERCQTPVVLLSDQLLGQSRATVPLDEAGEVVVEDRRRPDPDELADYRRYRDTPDGVSPAASPGEPQGLHLATGLEHDERGLPDFTPGNHRRMSRKRARKLDLIVEPGFRVGGAPGASFLLIGCGSVCGILEEAARSLGTVGTPTGVVELQRLAPWPEGLAAAVAGRTLGCVEMNFSGQLENLLLRQGIRARRYPWGGGRITAASICVWVREGGRAEEKGDDGRAL